jgi:NhaP-type Na+/H+ or K+/H+ antiporter
MHCMGYGIALIFDSAFGASFNWFERAAIPSVLLAGPGAIITASLTAILARYGFNYDWNWSTCFMFGSMLSATDPVAITALLRNLGAGKSIGTLIEAESLYNDGSAFVLYIICRDIVIGSGVTVGGTILNFLQITLGAIIFGLIFGYIAVIVLSWIYGKPSTMGTTLLQ